MLYIQNEDGLLPALKNNPEGVPQERPTALINITTAYPFYTCLLAIEVPTREGIGIFYGP